METKNLKTHFEPQQVTLRLPKLPSWNITELTGYEPKTTFWDDFSIADMINAPESVLDTFKRAFRDWHNDVRYMAELALVLNHKGWYHYDNGREILSKVYFALWEKLDIWCKDNFTDEAAKYYFDVTD